MNVKRFFIGALLLVAGLGTVLQAETQIQLVDGSRLTGPLQTGEAQHWQISPYWASPSLQVPLEIITSLEAMETSERNPEGLELFLVGGSRIWLQEAEVVQKEVRGITSWGERVRIPFSDLLYLTPDHIRKSNQALLRSAVSQQEGDSFLVGNRVMMNTYGQRHFDVADWPERFLLDVHLRETEGDLAFEVHCRGADLRRDAHFMIRCYPDHVRVNVFDPEESGRLRSMNFPYPLMPDQPVLRLRVKGDLSTGEMALQIGEGETLTWTMNPSDLFVSSETQSPGIFIQNRMQNENLELLGLNLQAWEPEAFPPLSLDQPGLILQDGEVLLAEVENLNRKTSELNLKTDSGERREVSLQEVWNWFPSGKPSASPHHTVAEMTTLTSGELLLLSSLDVEASTSKDEVQISGTLAGGTKVNLSVDNLRGYQRRSSGSREEWGTSDDPVLLGMLNGDLLQAGFQGMTGSALDLRVPWMKEQSVSVSGAALRSMRRVRAIDPSQGKVLLKFSNGCGMIGDLKEMDQQNLTIQSSWAETLDVKRNRIQSVRRLRNMQSEMNLLTYDLQEWMLHSDQTVLLKDAPDAVGVGMDGIALVKPGVYTRETKPIPSNQFYLRMILSGEEQAIDGPVRIEINGFSNAAGRARSLTLHMLPYQFRVQMHGQNGVYEQWRTRFENEPGGVIDLQVELNEASGFLRVDFGEEHSWSMPVKDWTFSPEPLPLELKVGVSGTGVGTMLRQVTLYESLEEVPPEISAKDQEPGNVIFKNGDRMQAEALQLNGENVTLKLEGGQELQLPFDRMYFLSLGEADARSLRKRRSHARFILGGGDERFLAEVLAASSEGFQVRREGIDQEWTIPFTAIRRIEFNPYTP